MGWCGPMVKLFWFPMLITDEIIPCADPIKTPIPQAPGDVTCSVTSLAHACIIEFIMVQLSYVIIVAVHSLFFFPAQAGHRERLAFLKEGIVFFLAPRICRGLTVRYYDIFHADPICTCTLIIVILYKWWLNIMNQYIFLGVGFFRSVGVSIISIWT